MPPKHKIETCHYCAKQIQYSSIAGFWRVTDADNSRPFYCYGANTENAPMHHRHSPASLYR
jgi:hypothetical protein